MRAWRVDGHGAPSEVLRLAETDVPEPTAGLLRVRVAAAGVGLPDVAMCRGAYALTPPLPFTPGQEGVGVVDAPAPGGVVGQGERVMGVAAFFAGRGSFADYALALDDFALPVPDEMSDAEAAGFVIPFHTAWVALERRGALRQGETLLVLGAAGGTGSAAVQLGVALGARVIATAGGPDKAEFCRELGADTVIDYRSADIAEAVEQATAGRGAELVFDAVGGDAFEAATRCIAPEGRILMIGFGSGSWGRPSTPHLVTHNYSVVGVMPGAAYDRAYRLEVQAKLLEHWRAGRLRVPVHRRVPFAELPGALEELAAGGVRGKLVLDVCG